jgi:hypothetical protein
MKTLIEKCKLTRCALPTLAKFPQIHKNAKNTRADAGIAVSGEAAEMGRLFVNIPLRLAF